VYRLCINIYDSSDYNSRAHRILVCRSNCCRVDYDCKLYN